MWKYDDNLLIRTSRRSKATKLVGCREKIHRSVIGYQCDTWKTRHNFQINGSYQHDGRTLQHARSCTHHIVRPKSANPVTEAMPICIECRYPVKTLYTEYSGADDRSSGHGVRLTVCKNCGRFCDKYVEHDFVVLFIDLVLIKPQVC